MLLSGAAEKRTVAPVAVVVYRASSQARHRNLQHLSLQVAVVAVQMTTRQAPNPTALPVV
jgi:hypothetical protein